MKLATWNVNGIRASLNKGLKEYLLTTDADVVCLQETKAQPEQVDLSFLEGWHSVWNCAEKKGYSGTCVLARAPMTTHQLGMDIPEHDREGRVDMASAQGGLGAALYRHYGLDMDDTYLFLRDGRAFTKSAGYLELFSVLGGWWRLLRMMQVVPEAVRDWLYDRVAANRYRWFGKADYCALLTEAQRARLIG